MLDQPVGLGLLARRDLGRRGPRSSNVELGLGRVDDASAPRCSRAARAPPPPSRAAASGSPTARARARRRRRCGRRARSRAARRSGSASGRRRRPTTSRPVELHLDRHGQAVRARHAASRRRSRAPAGSIGSTAPGHVDARRAPARLAVERRARARRTALTSAMCTQTRQRAAVEPLGRDRVVEVARADRVDRERRQVAQVAPASPSSSGPLGRRRAPRARRPRRSARRSPRSSISASITSRATSGRPSRAQHLRARAAPPAADPRRTRSPARALRGRGSTVHDPRAPALEERLARRGTARAAPARRRRRRAPALTAASPASARARRRAPRRARSRASSRRATSGLMPAPCLTPPPPRLRPLGRKYWPTVMSSAPPLESSSTSWKTPLPNVRVPTIVARWRSCSAPATISAADAVLPSTSTPAGSPARSRRPSRVSVCASAACARAW